MGSITRLIQEAWDYGASTKAAVADDQPRLSGIRCSRDRCSILESQGERQNPAGNHVEDIKQTGVAPLSYSNQRRVAAATLILLSGIGFDCVLQRHNGFGAFPNC